MTAMPIDWDDEVVRRYLTPESHQKSKEEFEKTHIDIDKIKAEYLFPHPTNDEFVTQEEFRDAILKSTVTDDNRIFILRGETGSGKSQLCQWLEYQIGRTRDAGEDDTHIALHVSRSQTRIKDIVDILTEPVDVEIRVGNVEDLNPEKVAEAMIANLDAYAPTAFQELTESEVRSLIENRSNGIDLRDILVDNIRSYQEAVGNESDDPVPDLIDEDDYRQLSLAAFNRARGGETIFPKLRGFLHDELSGKLNVGNFQEKLEKISDAYVEEGLRPVLICEDLTTFSVLKEQLLDHIFQLDSGHYDVVLGWTTGWEKDDLAKALGTSENTYTYMKDRAEGYLSTTDETGQAYFLTEDVTVELARKYVSVIRDESDADPEVEISEGAFDALYPFNAEFIRRAYEHLVQDGNERRTPRLLLIRIVRECLTATSPPFESIDGNPYVKQFPSPVPIDLPTDVQSLGKWYGIPTAEGNIRIPRPIFEVFNVEIPDSALDADGDDVLLQGEGPTPVRNFTVDQVDGTIEPGASVTLKTSLNGRPEPDAEIEIDGEPIGFTDDTGQLEVTLPNEEGDVTFAARKSELTDSIEFAVGTDSLRLSASPSNPNEDEEVTVTARYNGDPVGGVEVYNDGESVGTTDSDGTLELVATDPPQMTLSGQIDGVEDEITVPVVADGTIYPVETDLPADEVDQRRFEYQQWLKTGDEYDSSETLRQGAVEVLEQWHDPTRLANPNASTTGTAGIYYARGSETPVSIQSVNERVGHSIELPFGPEYHDTYEPLLWCGISSDGELPREDRYELNYDLLRGWADDRVGEFRAGMRQEIEDCLPDDWTFEEFIIVAQFLLLNGGQGVTELSRELVFREYGTPHKYDHPVGKRFSTTHPYRQAYSSLSKSSSVPRELAEGFFKLKENFVDSERLSSAYDRVEANLDEYLTEAMYIDEGDLPDAYRVGTTRSNAGTKLGPLFKRVKEYAQELNALGGEDVDHIVAAIDRIDEWFDPSQNVPELRELYERLYESVGDLDVNIKDRWEKQLRRLESEEEIHLTAFKSDVEALSEVESKSGPELVALLHEYERSRKERVEWEIYEAISEMIEVANDVEVPETGTQLEDAVRSSEEMKAALSKRSAVKDAIGGGR